jgi:hypothetical protein
MFDCTQAVPAIAFDFNAVHSTVTYQVTLHAINPAGEVTATTTIAVSAARPCSVAGGICAVGDTGQHGGVVVAISDSGRHGLEVLPANLLPSSLQDDTGNWAQAMQFASAFDFNGTGWRLPTKAEVENNSGIYCGAQPVNQSPGVDGQWWCWTSTTDGDKAFAFGTSYWGKRTVCDVYSSYKQGYVQPNWTYWLSQTNYQQLMGNGYGTWFWSAKSKFILVHDF